VKEEGFSFDLSVCFYGFKVGFFSGGLTSSLIFLLAASAVNYFDHQV
jgi:hypothetical protein